MKYRFNIINCEKPGSQFNSGEPIVSCTYTYILVHVIYVRVTLTLPF